MTKVPKPPRSEELAKLELRLAELLTARDFRAASLLVAAYEAKQPVPRGMGVNWGNYNPDSDVDGLSAIFSDPLPETITGVRVEAIETLRITAGLMWLFGVSRPYRRWLPRDFESSLTLSGDACAQMLIFHGYSARDAGNARRGARVFAGDAPESSERFQYFLRILTRSCPR